jgi:pilus assembly protein Flp/PilA
MFKQLTRFAKDEDGAALVEYGLLVGLVAVVCIVGVTRLGGNVNDVFCAINNAIAAVPALAAVGAIGGC